MTGQVLRLRGIIAVAMADLRVMLDDIGWGRTSPHPGNSIPPPAPSSHPQRWNRAAILRTGRTRMGRSGNTHLTRSGRWMSKAALPP